MTSRTVTTVTMAAADRAMTATGSSPSTPGGEGVVDGDVVPGFREHPPTPSSTMSSTAPAASAGGFVHVVPDGGEGGERHRRHTGRIRRRPSGAVSGTGAYDDNVRDGTSEMEMGSDNDNDWSLTGDESERDVGDVVDSGVECSFVVREAEEVGGEAMSVARERRRDSLDMDDNSSMAGASISSRNPTPKAGNTSGSRKKDKGKKKKRPSLGGRTGGSTGLPPLAGQSRHQHHRQHRPLGMINLGNTCYMNAATQMLLSLPNFVSDLCTHDYDTTYPPSDRNDGLDGSYTHVDVVPPLEEEEDLDGDGGRRRGTLSKQNSGMIILIEGDSFLEERELRHEAHERDRERRLRAAAGAPDGGHHPPPRRWSSTASTSISTYPLLHSLAELAIRLRRFRLHPLLLRAAVASLPPSVTRDSSTPIYYGGDDSDSDNSRRYDDGGSTFYPAESDPGGGHGGGGGAVDPSEVKCAVDAKAVQFVGYGQQDAHEFLSCLIDLLHDEMMDGWKRRVEEGERARAAEAEAKEASASAAKEEERMRRKALTEGDGNLGRRRRRRSGDGSGATATTGPNGVVLTRSNGSRTLTTGGDDDEKTKKKKVSKTTSSSSSSSNSSKLSRFSTKKGRDKSSSSSSTGDYGRVRSSTMSSNSDPSNPSSGDAMQTDEGGAVSSSPSDCQVEVFDGTVGDGVGGGCHFFSIFYDAIECAVPSSKYYHDGSTAAAADEGTVDGGGDGSDVRRVKGVGTDGIDDAVEGTSAPPAAVMVEDDDHDRAMEDDAECATDDRDDLDDDDYVEINSVSDDDDIDTAVDVGATSSRPMKPRKKPPTPPPTLPTDHFLTVMRVRLTCDSPTCDHTRTFEETYRHISVDVSPTLSDGLAEFFKPQRVEVRCEVCKVCESATRTMEVVRAPRALLIHVKRFRVEHGSGGYADAKVRKDESRVEFGERIEMGAYLASTDGGDDGDAGTGTGAGTATYGLRSVVHHVGTSADCGHYIADAVIPPPRGGGGVVGGHPPAEKRGASSSPKNEQQQRQQQTSWCRFNDDVVTPIPIKTVLGGDLRGTAYMMMYELEGSSRGDEVDRSGGVGAGGMWKFPKWILRMLRRMHLTRRHHGGGGGSA